MGRIECGYRGPDILGNGLALYLDANSRSSYQSFTRGDVSNFGATWRDISGNGRDATLSNSPTFSNGTGSYSGGMFIYEKSRSTGTTTGYTLPAQNSTTSFTICAWVWPTVNADIQPIVGRRGGAELNFVRLNVAGASYFANNTSGADVELNWGPVVNTWQYACFVKNLTNFYTYKNGALNATSGSSNGSRSSQLFYVGGDVGASEWSDNRIAAIHVYERALSASEILQNYNTTKTRFGL